MGQGGILITHCGMGGRMDWAGLVGHEGAAGRLGRLGRAGCDSVIHRHCRINGHQFDRAG